MLNNAIWFVLGVISFPLFYVLLTSRLRKKYKEVEWTRIEEQSITPSLRKIVLESTRTTTDVAWFNVFVQKMFLSAAENVAFEQKIKKTLIKSLSPILRYKILQSVTITRISFGSEAPYIEDIRIVDTSNLSENTRKESQESASSRGLYKAVLKNISVAKLRTEKNMIEFGSTISAQNSVCLKDIAENDTADVQKAQNIFDNFTLGCNISYNGGLQIVLELELPGKVYANAFIVLQKVNGLLLYRLRSHSTCHDISFAKTPEIDLKVVINGGSGSVMREIGKLIRIVLINRFKKLFVYPVWFSQQHWFIPSDIKFYESKQPINVSKKGILNEIVSCVKVAMGSNYRAVSRDGPFIWSINKNIKTYHGFLEGSKNFFDCEAALDAIERCDLVSISLSSNAFPKKSRISQIFSKKPYEKATDNKKKKKIKVKLSELAEERGDVPNFIKIRKEGVLIYYLNPTTKGDFIAFRATRKSLHIYCRNPSSKFKFGKKRMYKVAKWVISHLNSRGEQQNSTERPESNLEIERKINEILQSDLADLTSHIIEVSISVDLLKELLEDKALRGRLISDFGTLEVKTKTESIINSENLLTIYNVKKQSFIADISLESGLFFFFDIKGGPDISTLEIRSRKDGIIHGYEAFCICLRIKATLLSGILSGRSGEYSIGNGYVREEVKSDGGGIYFEFETLVEDFFHLRISSCKHKKVLFEANKILSGSPCRVVLSTERDFISVTLTPRSGKNPLIKYRLLSIQSSCSSLVECKIVLSSRNKLRVPVFGKPENRIFWECPKSVIVYFKDKKKKVRITDYGILPSGSGKYFICFESRTKESLEAKVIAGSGIIPNLTSKRA